MMSWNVCCEYMMGLSCNRS